MVKTSTNKRYSIAATYGIESIEKAPKWFNSVINIWFGGSPNAQTIGIRYRAIVNYDKGKPEYGARQLPESVDNHK